MTAQISESLTYKGETVSMCTEPLGAFFNMGGANPGFVSNNSALWRGYIGKWEVLDDRLYLIDLRGMLDDGSQANIETVFPGFPDRVFAHWYSGIIRIPQGKLLEYVHMGYASKYERDFLLMFENGILENTEIHENAVSISDTAPGGYGIGGMTVFAVSEQTDDIK